MRNLKRETESLLVEVQNNAIKTNFIWQRKSIIRNWIVSLGYLVTKMKHYTINECSKQAKKKKKKSYKTKHDREFCKKLKFVHNTKWYIHENRDIGPAVRVFANGPGDLGSIPGRVIPKTLKMELDTTLLNTQHYKVRFKGKVEQSREWSSALPYTLV